MGKGGRVEKRRGVYVCVCVCVHAHICTQGSLWRVVAGEGKRRPTQVQMEEGHSGQGLCQQGMQVGHLWVGGAGGTYKGRLGGRS